MMMMMKYHHGGGCAQEGATQCCAVNCLSLCVKDDGGVCKISLVDNYKKKCIVGQVDYNN